MSAPLQLVFQGMDPSEAIASSVEHRFERLKRLAPQMVGCRVVIELAQKHQHQGRPVDVRIDLRLPGRELVVSRVADEDAYVALRDAFQDMRRQLEQVIQQQQARQLAHAHARNGTPVAREQEE